MIKIKVMLVIMITLTLIINSSNGLELENKIYAFARIKFVTMRSVNVKVSSSPEVLDNNNISDNGGNNITIRHCSLYLSADNSITRAAVYWLGGRFSFLDWV
jgi:hypothetical protein